MGQFIDLTGQKFGRLIVVKRMKNSADRRAMWLCDCSCGKQVIIGSNSLRGGVTRSCGCLRKELWIKRNTKHGCSYERLYTIWNSMIQRCNNPNTKSYKNYGGRGVKVCKRWMSVENFISDMAEYSDGMTIDRIDNNGDYTPENCRWATYSQQNRNYRRNILITLNNKTQCLKDWCKELGLDYKLVHNRIRKLNWPIEKALNIED